MIDTTVHSNSDEPLHSWFNGQSAAELAGGTGSFGAHEGGSPRERAALLGIEWLEEAPETSADAVASITADIAVRLSVVPVRFDNNRLVIAMTNPLDMAAADEVSTLTGKPV